jgi:hypothetical protein
LADPANRLEQDGDHPERSFLAAIGSPAQDEVIVEDPERFGSWLCPRCGERMKVSRAQLRLRSLTKPVSSSSTTATAGGPPSPGPSSITGLPAKLRVEGAVPEKMEPQHLGCVFR